MPALRTAQVKASCLSSISAKAQGADHIRNAIESMKSAEPRVLSIKSESTGRDSIRVSIEDPGSGIDPSNRDRIFKPLCTTKARGMGMGLAICQSIIDSHGGQIWMSAGASRGSIFHVELPIGSSKR